MICNITKKQTRRKRNKEEWRKKKKCIPQGALSEVVKEGQAVKEKEKEG